tara:strand:+ start:404 stop:1807 length:1404 start_codon:yes stop_codon:yes gene_type:complete
MSEHPYCVPTNELIVPANTIVAAGDPVVGYGIPPGTVVESVDDYGSEGQLLVTLNQTLWTGEDIPDGVTGNPGADFKCEYGWFTNVVFGKFTLETGEQDIKKTLSFKEDVKGWVSFKSFMPESAVSMANDYYTFFNGRLYRHHMENIDRNTFYSDVLDNAFTSSTVDVVLNDNPSIIKEFNTLNYEGSQSKVEKFVSAELHEDDPFQPTTTYNDQEYYNLYEKHGWSVQSIITNDEDGYIDEFLEKEGKWFNNIKREVNLNLQEADTGDFSFQGIGFASIATENIVCATCDEGTIYTSEFASFCPEGWVVFGSKDPCEDDDDDNGEDEKGINCYRCLEGILDTNTTNYISMGDGWGCPEGWTTTIPECEEDVYGCTDRTASNYNPSATIDDGSCEYEEDDYGTTVLGCMDPTAFNYNIGATVDDGTCIYITPGCTDPEASNYDPNADVDDGSCVYRSSSEYSEVKPE